jgi:Bacterial protein of unknown function (DUF899)
MNRPSSGRPLSRLNVARPPVVSQTDWDAALTALTEHEEAVAAALHELAAVRKRMPMVRVEHEYEFAGPDGERSLPELFAATAARVRPLGSGRATRRQEQRCLREAVRSNRTTTKPARRERRP